MTKKYSSGIVKIENKDNAYYENRISELENRLKTTLLITRIFCIIIGLYLLFGLGKAEDYPYFIWDTSSGGSSYNLGATRDNVTCQSSSSYTCYLSNSNSGGYVSVVYTRTDYDEWYSGSTVGLYNATSEPIIVSIGLDALNPDQSNPTFYTDSTYDDADEIFDSEGFINNVTENGYDVTDIATADIPALCSIAGGFIATSVSGSLDVGAIGSIVVGINGLKESYVINEVAAAIADLTTGIANIPSGNDGALCCTLSPNSRYSTVYGGAYYWKVSGANTYHKLCDFSYAPMTEITESTPEELFDLYNANRGTSYTYYTTEEIIDMCNPAYDGDVSLGTGSTNNFKGLLEYLFMPSYTGIEENYDEMLDGLGILYMPIDYMHCILGTVAGTYSSTMDLSWDDISVQGIEIDGSTFSFNPRNVIPNAIFLTFQYFAMFVVLCGLSIHTYRHLFSKNSDEGGSAI